MSEHVQISALEISGSHGAMGNVCKYQSNASQKCNLFKKVCVVHRCNLKSEKIFCLAKQLLVLLIYLLQRLKLAFISFCPKNHIISISI